MGLLTALTFTPLIVIGVTFGSPFILGFAGLTAVGPVAGGAFALAQAGTAGGIYATGTWMAVAQSLAMLPTP